MLTEGLYSENLIDITKIKIQRTFEKQKTDVKGLSTIPKAFISHLPFA